MMNKTKRMTQITMLVAISILFHMIEATIPLPLFVPGFKLGLANIVGLVALYLFGVKAMLEINLMRVLLASLLRGMLFGTSFWLSLFGVTLSCIAVVFAYKKTSMSMFGVSVAGSVFHAIGQVIAVTMIYNQFFMQAFLPFLILLAIPTGLFIALVGKQVVKRLHV